MATLTNTSSHPLVLADLTIQPGEVIEDFDDKAAEDLKDSLFVEAGWLVIEVAEPVEPKAKAK
ncbi:hypothetical protein [Pseudomonas sp. IT-P218]|uniref:hypothetical protein n=1 Tax=Pseudomonas sp. IT-P218 TaxID=3026449 RepID=UPI0039DFBB18